MNKLIATLIAGLFATSVFAQAPATTPAAPATAAVATVKAEMNEVKVATSTDAKVVAKAEVKDAKVAAVVKADAGKTDVKKDAVAK